jgi:hypothetical protein
MSVSQVVPAAISFAASGDNIVVAAVAGKAIRVVKIWLVLAGDSNLTFKDGASTSLSGIVPMLGNGSFFFPADLVIPHFITTTGNAFIINSSVAVQVSGTVYYELTNV